MVILNRNYSYGANPAILGGADAASDDYVSMNGFNEIPKNVTFGQMLNDIFTSDEAYKVASELTCPEPKKPNKSEEAAAALARFKARKANRVCRITSYESLTA